MSESEDIGAMSVTCCGDKRQTPYCPMCGKELAPEASVISLLSYLTNNANKQRGELERTTPGTKTHANRLRTAEKWQTWALGVKKLADFYEQHSNPDQTPESQE